MKFRAANEMSGGLSLTTKAVLKNIPICYFILMIDIKSSAVKLNSNHHSFRSLRETSFVVLFQAQTAFVRTPTQAHTSTPTCLAAIINAFISSTALCMPIKMARATML